MNRPYTLGEWTIDPNRCLARRYGKDVHLEPKSVELLNYLAMRAGEVISRDDLLDGVWPEVTVGDEVITNTIAKLRRVFRDDPQSTHFIETIPKRGYRLTVRVDAVQRQLNQRRWPVLVFVLLAIVIGIVGMAALWQQDWNADRSASSQADDLKPTVAVLPFINLSGDKEQEYFSDGLTEDLITDLSKISALTVVSRTSTFAYKGKAQDIRELAKALKVRYVVEGSVRKAEGKIRITAQLVEAATGNHLWAERYDRDFKDIFTLQDEVRDKIVTALSVKLTPDEERRLARHISNNSEAYDLYLKGLQQESYFSKEGNTASLVLFQNAIQLDPSFAAAYSHLAQAYSLGTENRWTDTPQKFEKMALKMAQTAVQLNDELPYAYWSLGRIYSRSYIADLDQAKSAMEKAIDLNTNYADGYMFLAQTLVYMGHAESALAYIEKAMRLNPHFPFWYLHTLGTAQYFLSHYEAAIKSFSTSIGRNPTVPWMHRYLIASYGQVGMIEEAEWQMLELESLEQHVTIEEFMKKVNVQDPLYRKAFLEGLHKAGLPENE